MKNTVQVIGKKILATIPVSCMQNYWKDDHKKLQTEKKNCKKQNRKLSRLITSTLRKDFGHCTVSWRPIEQNNSPWRKPFINFNRTEGCDGWVNRGWWRQVKMLCLAGLGRLRYCATLGRLEFNFHPLVVKRCTRAMPNGDDKDDCFQSFSRRKVPFIYYEILLRVACVT